MKLKDDPNQSAHLCMIAQSEDSVKTDEPGHEKSTRTNVCGNFLKEKVRLVYD